MLVFDMLVFHMQELPLLSAQSLTCCLNVWVLVFFFPVHH